MIRRELSQLAIYECEETIETLPFTQFRNLYLKKTAEIIYITRRGKLYGIVSFGDVIRHDKDGEVCINKNFISLTGCNVIKAYRIFHEKKNIHKIPILDEQGILIGDYSRWDDMLYIQRNQDRIMCEMGINAAVKAYSAVYIINPVERENILYEQLLKYLSMCQITYKTLDKVEIVNNLLDNALYIFLNEDEMRGTQCFYISTGDCDRISFEGERKVKFVTYKTLLMQMEEYICCAGIENGDLTNEKTNILLSALLKRGIQCFYLCTSAEKITEYENNFKREMDERLKIFPMSLKEPWPQKGCSKEYYESFYEGLFQNKDYENETAQREIYAGACSFEYDRNIAGKFFNAKDGKRVTCFQPSEYVGTIYLFGRCTFVGFWVEDQYTISSMLQKKVNDRGYAYRVENYCGMLRNDAEIDSRLQEIEKFSKNDIVIVLTTKPVKNILGKSIVKLFEENSVPSEWVTDALVHCNHKGNKVIADGIFNMIETNLLEQSVETEYIKKVPVDLYIVMQHYVQKKYLIHYFADFYPQKYHTIGAVVMSCAPFSVGHHYLIQRAKAQVEFLIIFIVEEDIYEIGFEERFKMVVEGTKDINNIKIIPGGDFVLSRNNFPEYYVRHNLKGAEINAEYDAHFFADYIAKPLGITYRFAGEEKEDGIKKIYNSALGRILPQKGIIFKEIPKKKLNGNAINTSVIRKYLKNGMYGLASEMLLNSTLNCL